MGSDDSVRPARVEARGWGWRHAGRRRAAVHAVDFAVEPGERVLLLGPSGAGKSTLLHGLAGVLGGDEEGDAEGLLLVDGVDAAQRRGRAGLVLQDPESQIVMTRIGDDVAFGCENLGVPRERIGPRVRAALATVGLDFPLEHPSAALSGGQQQRLALAGVLAMRPGLLLLDEPTANLDPEGVLEVRDAVHRAADETGATLIVVEHRVATWLPVVDRVIVLGADGGVLADGPAERLLVERASELRAAGVWLPDDAPAKAAAPIAASAPLLTADGLGIARVPRRVVADGLALRVDAARVLAVTGPNGSGKTTLALTLAGLLPEADGSLRASDGLAAGLRERRPIAWRSRELLTRIGTVFQHPGHQFLAATVRAELEFGPARLRLAPAERRDRVDELLQTLRLDRLAEANPFTLSGGEQRRLSVATALATRPRMLVLDEPTFGQDAHTWRELVRMLAELRDGGVGVVAVTHDRDVVAALADAEFVLGARAEVAA